MRVKIETALLDDLDKLCEIEKESFGKEAFTRSHIANLLDSCSVIGLAASVNGEIAGFIIALAETTRRMTIGHIVTLDVSPRYRRKGIAEKLLQFVEVQLKEKGIGECRLEVREDNTAALNLYSKLGYKTIGRLEKYYGTAHGLYLRKILVQENPSS